MAESTDRHESMRDVV